MADVLNNPLLKSARDRYGTAGDKRFSLVDSEAWAWKDYRPSVPGHQLMPATRAGNRLLGVRIDQYGSDENAVVTVTLVNAGGKANGEAVGGVTLRHSPRMRDKGRTVELTG